MAAYLRLNTSARSQFRSPRRSKPRRVIVVHTAENPADPTGVDSGAENVARFIATRIDAGSYHDLVDSDSWIHLVDYADEAYHCATHSLNWSTTGLSFACRTTDWATMDVVRRDRFLMNGATAAVAQAQYQGGVSPVRLTLAQVLGGASGFIAHADTDPGRRSDPGHLFPWTRFFGFYSKLLTPDPILPEDDDDMPANLITLTIQGSPHIWTVDLDRQVLTRVQDPDDLSMLRALAGRAGREMVSLGVQPPQMFSGWTLDTRDGRTPVVALDADSVRRIAATVVVAAPVPPIAG